MPQPVTESLSADHWLVRLQGLSPEVIEPAINLEDSRMAAKLTMLAGELHTAMAAWHSLGTPATVGTLFRQLEQYLAGISHNRSGWLRSLVLRLKDFFRESGSQPEFPEDILRQLELAHQNTITYQQRMKAGAEEHARALEAYTAWISALTRLKALRESPPVALLADVIRRSAEIISAQQQLALAVALQQQNIQIMAADIRHITTVARSLSMNKDAARQLLELRYRGEINRLREYTGEGKTD